MFVGKGKLSNMKKKSSLSFYTLKKKKTKMVSRKLKKTKTKVTKLAQGLPVGGEIESLDDGTLYSAFKFRSDLNSNSD